MKGIISLLLVLVLMASMGCQDSHCDGPTFERPSRGELASQGMEVGEAVTELGEDATLSDYLKYAALHNPGLEAAFYRWKAAAEKATIAGSLPDPKFTYKYFIEEIETRVGAQRQSFGIAQAFPWLGTLELRKDAAAKRAQARRWEYEKAKLDLFYRVQKNYYEYAYLGRSIEVTQENLDLMAHLEEVARSRYRAAAAKHPDLVRAQIELGKLEDRLRSLEDLKGPLAAKLNAVLNRPVNTEIVFPALIESPDIHFDEAQLQSQLTQWNPDLKALDAETAASRDEIELAQKEYWPDVTAGFEFIDVADRTDANPGDDGKDPVVAMFTIDLPIWHGKYAAGVRKARAEHRAALQMRRERLNSLQADLKMALFTLNDARRKIGLYRNTLIPKATEALEVGETSFKAGSTSFTDLIESERILLEYALAMERAMADEAIAMAEIRRMTGITADAD